MFVNIAMFYTRELFVPYSRIFRYWPSLVNGAVISTSDPCTTHVVSKHLVIVSRIILMSIAEPVVGLVSSSTCSFGKFGGQIPPAIAKS